MDGFDYANLMKVAVNEKDWELSCSLYDTMVNRGVPPIEDTYLALLFSLRRGGQLDRSLEALKEMQAAGLGRNPLAYTEVILTASGKGDCDTVLRVLQQVILLKKCPYFSFFLTTTSIISTPASGIGMDPKSQAREPHLRHRSVQSVQGRAGGGRVAGCRTRAERVGCSAVPEDTACVPLSFPHLRDLPARAAALPPVRQPPCASAPWRLQLSHSGAAHSLF